MFYQPKCGTKYQVEGLLKDYGEQWEVHQVLVALVPMPSDVRRTPVLLKRGHLSKQEIAMVS